MRRLRHLLGFDEPQETKFFVVIAGWGIFVAIVYWFVAFEPAGTVLLGGLGLASAVVAARLVIAARASGVWRAAKERASSGPAGMGEREESEGGTGGIDTPFAAASRIPDPSLAPLAVGLGIALIALGPVFGIAPVALGVVPFVWGAVLWLGAANDEFDATAELDPVPDGERARRA
jgi:hypothetical protein